MRTLAPSFSHSRKLICLFAAVVLALSLLPVLSAQPVAVADEASDAVASEADASLAGLLSSGAEDANGSQDGDEASPEAAVEGPSTDGSEEVPLVAASQLSREVALQPLAEGEGVPLVADALAGKPTCFVNQEVSLDGQAFVLGSFTIDGMTYAVTGEGAVELVAVGPAALAGDPAEGSSAGLSGADGEDRGIGSGVPPRSVAEQVPSGATSPQPQPSPSAEASTQGEHADDLAADDSIPSGEDDAEGSGAEGAKEPTVLALPESVEHDGVIYSVTSIGPRALAGCDADVVRIPASVASVDEAAFRGSSVGSVEVAEGNPNLASYEGVLYDADYSSLLLIPEGKKGVVRIHSNTSAITPEAFSHCASVTSVEVDAGNESFYVEDGVLYDGLDNIVTYGASQQSDGSAATASRPIELTPARSANGARILLDLHTAGYLPVYATNSYFFYSRSAEEGAHNAQDGSPCKPGYDISLSFSPAEMTGLTESEVTYTVNLSETYEPADHRGADFGNVRPLGSSLPYLGFINPNSRFVSYCDRCFRVFSAQGIDLQTNQDDYPTAYKLHYKFSPSSYFVDRATGSVTGPASVDWVDSRTGITIRTDRTSTGGELTAPSASTPGYTLLGWTTSSGSNDVFCGVGESIRVSGSGTFYTVWSPNPYTIHYHSRSGAYLGSQQATYDSGLNLWEAAGGSTGYTANGWATSAWQSSGSYGLGAWASNLATGGTVNLYLAESANPYTIRYHDKAGNHIGTDQKAYDAWFNLRGDPGRTHPAYTARGWARSANQTGASHAFGLWTRNLASAQGANFDLYVAETANTYSISYDTAGGQLSGQRAEYTFEAADFRLAEPTRVGYTFAGWEVSGAQGSGIAKDGVHSTVRQGTWGSLSCKATWRANQYQVSLDAAFPAFAQGPTYEGYAPYGVAKDAGTASVTATYDSAMPSATMPRATGYRFEGYFDDAGVKYYDADGSSARTWDKPNNATLHARWSVERHELTLDVGNGEVPSAPGRGWVRDAGDSGLYRLSYSIEWVEESGGSLRIQLPVPATKPGYSAFDGWTGGGISKPSKSVIVQPWELADRAYTGAFSGPFGYTATLDLAGGSFPDAPEGWAGSGDAWSRSFTVESDAFSLPVPARDGYDFQGWAAVAADGSLGALAKDVTVPKGSWGDRSWRAAWKAIEYRISYDLAGGTMSGERTSYTIEDAGFELPVPAREGYSFQGWEVTGANGAGLSQSGVVTTVRQGTWGDLHATARWATVSYVASLDLDGGSFASAPAGWSEAAGSWTRGFTVESDAFELPTPARAGHDFQGWALVGADGSLGSPAASVTVPKGTVGDRAYRAVWRARSYSITWHYSGQSIDGQQSATSSQAYGQAIAFPSRPSVADPAREHYAFEGWFTEREGGERVEAGDYLAESDSTFYARWKPVEYTVHLHLGDDDAYGEHKASIEQDGQALPLASDGHFDLPYTVEGEVRLPMVTDDPSVPKPVREGMSFVGWVECAEDGSFDSNLVPSMEVVLPVGSHGERHYRAVWSFALRFEVPSAVGFRFDLADDPAFEHAPHGPVHVVSGDGVEMRSLSLGQLAVADVAVDVAGADPDAIVSDRSKVQLRVMDASLPDPWTGWVPLPTTSAPERVDPYDLGALGFGDGNALAPLASKPLRYDIEVQDPVTTLAGEVDAPLAKIVFTVKGLW